MKVRFYKKLSALAVLMSLVMAICTVSSSAADEISRRNGVIARIGAGAPGNLEIGAGYRFNQHFSIAGEVFSYSGLTTVAGVADARYYILDKNMTPFVAAKIGYGTLGRTIENTAYRNGLASLMAGLSWHGFDLGAGIIYDPFHNMGFTADLSWTYYFKRKQD